MAIQITCSACNVRLSLGDDRAGDRFECPQCDAMIKVPYPEGQSAPPPAEPKPLAKPARAPRPLEPDYEDEPQGPDKRVIGGILAGVAAVLIVGVAVVAFAVRKPKENEVAKADEAPAPAVVKPLVTPPPPPKKTPDAPPPKPADNTPSKVETPPIDFTTPPAGKQYITTFLGSQAKGRRFCIIADNSGSMTGPKLADLKTQTLKTLDEMDPNAEYFIYFFNSASEPMPNPTWLKPGAAETEKVKKWVRDTPARGGTNPQSSFEAALRLDPKPDVIFLMTDGQFSTQIPPKMADLNGTPPKSLVNTILFEPKGGAMPKLPPGVPPKIASFAENQLRGIAEKGGGTFTRYSP